MATARPLIQHSSVTIRKIAVLTDFSKNADIALRYAAAFARGYKAELVLAHAYLLPASALAAPDVALVYEAFDGFRKSLDIRLHQRTEDACLKDVKSSVLRREGGVKELLESLSGTDLVVVGTSGETGLEKAAFGSTAEYVFRSSSVPVLTVGPRCPCRDAGEIAVRTILYATDFSAGSQRAFEYALSIAATHEAALVLLHAVSDKDIQFSFERTMAGAEPMEKLRGLVPEAITFHHKPLCVVGFGNPETVILEEAGRHEADLIVVGVRGSGAFVPAISHLGGGTAYKVAAHAHCPVLTVRKS